MTFVHRSLRLRATLVGVTAGLLFPLLVAPVASADDGVAAGDTVVGELVQAWSEPESQGEAANEVHADPLTWIETADGEAVRVPTGQVDDLPLGATVEVTVGEEVSDEATEETGLELAREVLSAQVVAPGPAEPPNAPALTPLTNQVTVAMVVPAGGTQDSTTLSQMVAAVDDSVAPFWSSESQGTIALGVTAQHDWMTTTATCADPTALWNEVATRVGFTAGPGKHLMLYVTSTPGGLSGCSYGLAQVGSGPGSGGRLYVRDTVTSVIAHEFGHNFGLGHSSGRQCNGAVEAGTCRTDPYRDYYDVMGISWEQVGSLNAVQADLLGVLPAAQKQTFHTSGPGGAVTLAPFSGRTGTRAVRMVDADGIAYWLEYRTSTGQDTWLGAPGTNRFALQSGVLLRRASAIPDTSLLLDGTPSPSAGWNTDMQTALPVNTAVPVSGGDFTVTVQGQSASGATVRVEPSTASRLLANNKPVGGLDPVTATGAVLGVAGWAVDPDDPTAPVQVHAYIDGRGVPLLANSTRAESLAVAGAGDAHGFSWSTQVLPGPHRVCMYAIDTLAGGGSTVLGCRDVSTASRPPAGTTEQLGASGTTLTVTGWAFDPDLPSVRIQVHVYVDGRGVPLIASGSTAPSASPDVMADYGFSWSTQLSGGQHQVCVYAIDATIGSPNTVLDCRTVTVALSPPVGALERVSVSGSEISVAGWALDPDAPAAPIQVHIYVDGRGLPVLTQGITPAGYPGSLGRHGFTGTLNASSGRHSVCVYAIDGAGGSGNTLLGCRSVVV